MTALLVLLSASCARGDEEKVVNAIKEYNKRLIEAYKKVDLEGMRDVATQSELNRLLPVIEALLKQDSVMISSQKAFVVKTVDVTGEKATVETEESWVYWWENPRAKLITRGKRELKYKVRYQLVKEDGRWKVQNLESWE